METTLPLTSKMKTQTHYQTSQKTGWFGRLATRLSPSYFGLIAMTISVGSCLGGIAAMHVLQAHAPIWQLALVMLCAMANLVAAIGQTPVKWVLGTFGLCTSVSIALILVHLI